MKRYGIAIFFFCFFIVGMELVWAATTGDKPFEFPELMVIVMNAIVVPLLVQFIKKITQVREIKALIAAVLSFITAIVGILLAGEGSLKEFLKLLVYAYSVAQLAYNFWWHRLLQKES